MRAFQRDKWGRSGNGIGLTAVVELSAIAAPSLDAKVEGRGEYLDDRLDWIRERLERHNRPIAFAVFYGLERSSEYEKIAGPFVDGYAWLGTTLCALVPHPVAVRGESEQWWLDKGREMQMMVADRLAGGAKFFNWRVCHPESGEA